MKPKLGAIKKITVDVKPFGLSTKGKTVNEDEEQAGAIAED